ncbi:MAG: hypothetical protein JW874_02990 [Spirochaetales bacterium]|nr:hypothetical protein [Spirochaetales bacterium]
MNEIINKVFEAEEKAEKILNDARNASSGINQKAQKDADDMILEARQKAKEILRERLEQAKTKTEQAYSKKAAAHEEDIRQLLENKKKEIDAAAEKIVALVMAPEYRNE